MFKAFFLALTIIAAPLGLGAAPASQPPVLWIKNCPKEYFDTEGACFPRARDIPHFLMLRNVGLFGKWLRNYDDTNGAMRDFGFFLTDVNKNAGYRSIKEIIIERRGLEKADKFLLSTAVGVADKLYEGAAGRVILNIARNNGILEEPYYTWAEWIWGAGIERAEELFSFAVAVDTHIVCDQRCERQNWRAVKRIVIQQQN